MGNCCSQRSAGYQAANTQKRSNQRAVPGGAPFFRNPVINSNWPDPCCIAVGGLFYVYATNSNNCNIQCAKSSDLVSWEVLPDALPELPSWARGGLTWAPNTVFIQLPDQAPYFVMYFVCRDVSCDKQVVGVAVADTPEGPFKPLGEAPFIAQASKGGTIDPFHFQDDDGQRWLLYKNDGNAVGRTCWLHIRRLQSDGLHFKGPEKLLIRNDLPWEGTVIEAPCLVKRGGRYHLFYSANGFASAEYCIGYATATEVIGPYRKSAMPLVSSAGQVVGPGACSIASGGPMNQDFLVYHSWNPEHTFRACCVTPIIWQKDGTPAAKATWGSDLPLPFS